MSQDEVIEENIPMSTSDPTPIRMGENTQAHACVHCTHTKTLKIEGTLKELKSSLRDKPAIKGHFKESGKTVHEMSVIACHLINYCQFC